MASPPARPSPSSPTVTGGLFARKEAGRERAVEGEVLRITFENEETGFRVLKLGVELEGVTQELVVVGSLPKVAPGTRVRVAGTRHVDPKFGEQLRAETLVELAPDTLRGLEKFLGSGRIPGVGPATAKLLVKHFGQKILQILDDAPERLREIPGLGKRKAAAIAEAWAAQAGLREIFMFLQAHGASPQLAARIHRRWGRDAVRIVQQDPYRLALEVWGVGFRTADKIAQSLGVQASSPRRLQAGILHVLHERSLQGHVCVTDESLRAAARTLLFSQETLGDGPSGLDDATLDFAVDALVLAKLAVRHRDAATWIYDARLWAEEGALVVRVHRLLERELAPIPLDDDALGTLEEDLGISLADAQRDAVRLAATAPFLIITGGPGVGKTTVVRALLALYKSAGLTVALAAPTGRAAKRMSEATGAEASTLHRLLEFDPKGAKEADAGGANRFKRGLDKPIDADVVIVDESSMMDVPLARAVLEAIPMHARVLLVGDVDQLPSVGPGAVLEDLLASKLVPSVRLTRIFRQGSSSLIVENAHRINDGELPIAPPKGELADFFLVERKEPEALLAAVLELVTNRIPSRFGYDPIRDVQVLVPMRSGVLGTERLNRELQQALNGGGPQVVRPRGNFRVGDKVMQLRNDYERNVWNGDIGFVASVQPDDDRLTVLFDDQREVAYDPSTLDELVLAYATTIHKSQGSEYPVVVLPLAAAHFVLLSKNLVYTAVTRGKKLVVVVTDGRALKTALSRQRTEPRGTRLRERLLAVE